MKAVSELVDAATDDLVSGRERLLAFLKNHSREMTARLGPADSLRQAGKHVFNAPGKLLRPLLLLEACKAAGGDPDVILPAAAGTEYGHMASLIHDDIIDESDQRRGQQALHVKFPLSDAILAGDLLIFQSYLAYLQCEERGVGSEQVLSAIRTLTTSCIQICRGQAFEAALMGDLEMSILTYLLVIRLKTASFYRAACRIGATLGGGSTVAINALASYGLNLGMGFQIIDDVLSYDGDAGRLGKPVGSDLHNRRVTLPVIYAMQSENPRLRRRLAVLFNADGEVVDGQRRLAGLLATSGSLARARSLASRYVQRAQNQLDLLPPTAARDRLSALADLSVSRDR